VERLIVNGKWMNVKLSEENKNMKSKKEGERIKECKRKKNDGEIQIWERGERNQVLDGRRGKKVQNVL
jgi:hypothetical protein